MDRRKGNTLEAKIDIEDLETLKSFKGKICAAWSHCTKTFYAQYTKYLGKIDGKHKYETPNLHTLIMSAPEGYVVDHINNDGLDNRKCNLRFITRESNHKNRNGKNSNNKSGYRNVCWVEREQRYYVQLQVEGKNTVLGKFKANELEEAGKFAEEMRQKYYKEYAGTNENYNKVENKTDKN